MSTHAHGEARKSGDNRALSLFRADDRRHPRDRQMDARRVLQSTKRRVCVCVCVVRLPNCRECRVGKHPRPRSLSGSRRSPSCHQLRSPLLRFSPACHSLSLSSILSHPPCNVSNAREQRAPEWNRHTQHARDEHTQVQGQRSVGSTRDNTQDRQTDVVVCRDKSHVRMGQPMRETDKDVPVIGVSP